MAALRSLVAAPLAALAMAPAPAVAPAAARSLPPLLRRLQQQQQQQQQRLLPPLSLRLPAPVVAAIAGASGLLADIWESILRAVPKKKTSHMKKRHRQMAGKALKDVSEVVKCPGCGRPKRAHILCPYCVQSIQHWLKGNEIYVPKD